MQKAVSIYVAPNDRADQKMADTPVEFNQLSDHKQLLHSSNADTEALPVQVLVGTAALSVGDSEGDTAVLMTKRFGKVTEIN